MPVSRVNLFLVAAVAVVVGVAAGFAGQYPAVPIVIAVGALIALAARRLDGWQVIYAVVILLTLSAASNIAILTRLSYHTRYVAVAALVACTFLSAAEHKRSVRSLGWPTRLLIGSLWAAAALAAFSSVWSVNRMETLQQSVALGLLAALVHGVISRRWAETHLISRDLGIAYVLLTLSFAASLLYTFIGGEEARTYSGRLQGLYANPNMLSLLCAIGIPVGWGLYRRSRRPLVLIGIVPAVMALVLSESRTALLAVAIGAFWVLARSGLGAVLRTVGTAALALFAIQLLGGLGMLRDAEWATAVASRFTAGEGGDISNGRIFAWQLTLDLWEARPGLGYGYAAGPWLFEATRQSDFFDFQGNSVHNSYLQWLLELGLAGLALLLLLGLVCLLAVTRSSVRGIGSGLVWLVVTGLLVQLTESAMFGTGQPYPYLFWLAVAGALVHRQGRVGPRHLRRKASEVAHPVLLRQAARRPAGIGSPGRRRTRLPA